MLLKVTVRDISSFVYLLFEMLCLNHFYRCKERGCLATFDAPWKLKQHQKRHDEGECSCGYNFIFKWPALQVCK